MEIELVPHNPDWQLGFDKEKSAILALFQKGRLTLFHIGSTAINGIWAKPIIDMLGVVQSFHDFDRESSKLEKLNYQSMGEFGIAGRRYFRKFSQDQKRTHQLHVFESGSAHVERHLAFCAYLQQFPAIAKQYSDLKCALVCGRDISLEAYQDGKDPFIKRTEAEAITWYRERK